jgi:inner membrane protein
MQDSIDRLSASLRSSRMLRLSFVAFLALLLQIPIFMIGQLVSERRARKDQAVAEVSSKWGNVQAITGPALILPYTHRWSEPSAAGGTIQREETRSAVFLPDRLHINANIDTDTRKRGIFAVPVYQADLTLSGEFSRPDVQELGIDPKNVDWSRAHLAVGIADTRAIQNATSVTWNGDSVSFLPGSKDFRDGGPGIHAPVGFPERAESVSFTFPISLNGSMSINMVPFSRNTVVELSGNTGSPSFQGTWLPTERSVNRDSFSARWSIPFLGRGYPQSWISAAAASEQRQAINNSRFGVELINPVDHYRMAERSVKYAALFILLTFAAVWLIEVLAGVRVHSIQYLMLGGALCLFYLLELSLAEHLGFPAAYTLASIAVVAMVGAYSGVALGNRTRAITVGAGVALLYGYLYLLLMNEDYALLSGSVGLFLILAAIMYATRRVNWHGADRAPAT